MAILGSCFCCSLLVAGCIVGVYSVIAYVVAFVIEIWWILEAEATLPAPAYILCAGYFLVLVLSTILLHGINVKHTLCLLGWLFTIVVFSFPEAGLVLFMSLHYWKVTSTNGLMELTYWACRIFCNAAGIICVQSLYSKWKEEINVNKRLHELNMVPVLPDIRRKGGSPSTDDPLKNESLSYAGCQNKGFENSYQKENIVSSTLPRARRSKSLVHLYAGTIPGGSLPKRLKSITPFNSWNSDPTTNSQFNACTFDEMFAVSVRSPFDPSLNGLENSKLNNKGLRFNRTQSLLDLRKEEFNCRDKLYSVPVKGINYLTTNQIMHRHCAPLFGARRALSMDELYGYLRHEKPIFPIHILYSESQSSLARNSRRSLASSDDLQKYRDIAL